MTGSMSAVIAGEVRANTYTADEQRYPAVAVLSDGGWVVTWHSRLQDGDGYGVYGQRYDASGAASGGEFRVSTNVPLDQVLSSVTALRDGGWLVNWASFGQDGSAAPSWGLYGQRFSASGATAGGEFKVSTYAPGAQIYQSTAGLADGGWIVTWGDSSQDGSGWGIYAQRYSASGAPSGGEFRVNTHTAINQNYPTVAALSDGGWVVAWQSNGQSDPVYRIYGQRFSSAGIPAGGEFRINTYTADWCLYPAVAALPDGGWVVVWQSNGQDGSRYGIYGQRYTAAGTPSGAEFKVNTFTDDDQQNPSVTALSDGGWVVAWQSSGQDGSGAGVYGQRYSSAGVALGAEFRLNVAVSGDQLSPELAALGADGNFIAAWQAPDASANGAFVARVGFAFVSSPVAMPVAVTADEDTVKSGRLDASGDGSRPFTYAKVSDPAHGTVTVNPDGVFLYTPEANFSGTDYFEFRVIDRALESAAATVSINVIPINDAPIAIQQSVTGKEDAAQRGRLAAIDVDAQSLIYTKASNPAFGSVTVTADGSFTYTPNAKFFGSDTFTFRASDGQLESEPATVTITVTPGNEVRAAPKAWEVRANTHTADEQRYPAAAVLADGGSVVTWHSRLQDGSGYGVYGQRFDAAGSAVGSEFKVNTHVLLDQVLSRVTALPDGGWLVTWASFGQDGSPSPSWGTYGQRYTAGGAASGAEFKVSTYTPGAQMYQSVAVLSDGGWVVTWADSSQDSSYWGVYGQRYRADGQASGGEFRVNTTTAQDQHYPAVAALTDGGWVVTWADSNHDGSGWGVYGQRYRSDGNADQKEFRINTTTANDQHHPGIAALSDGGWVVAWQSSGQDGSGWGIYARRYNSSGIASGEEFRINTTTAGDQQSPAVAALPDGGWVVAWQSADQDGSGWGVYGQRYSAAGVARGAEFRLSAQVAGDQTYPELAAALNGENPAIAVWQSPDGSMAGAFAAPVAFPAIEPPAAVAASVTTDEDTIKTGMLAATGGGSQSLTYSKVANPANGTVTVNADGTFTYTPNANFNGTDWFKFKASNGELESAPATVTVTVLPVDDEPIGEVTVHGIAIQGQSLTASHSLADADGLGPVSYQWQANSLNITGATGSALTLKQAQIGKVISVVASYTDIQGTPSVVSSAPTSVVVGNTAGFPSNQPLVIAPSSMSWPRSVDNATIEARWAPSSEFYGALYSWIRFDSQTGEISGTPPSAAIGYTRIQLRARYDDATDEQLTLGVIVTNEAGGGDVLGYVDVGSEWGLTTMPKPGVRDTVQPLISKVAPYEAAAGWPIDTPLYFRFSERVERGEGTITIRDEQNRLFESFSVAESLNLSLLRETSLRLTPSRLFESGTTYVVSISPDAFNDFAGNPLRTGQNFRFTTIANGQTPNVFVDVSDSSGREGLFFVEHSIKGPATMIGVEGWDHYWLDDVGDRIVDTGNDPKDEDWLSTGPDFSGRVVDLRLHPGVENLKPYFFSDHGYIGIGNELSNRFFMGTVFDDEIYGNGGNDVLEGGEGNDTMDGGPGDDEFQVLQLGDKIIERPGEGFDVVRIHDVIGYTIDPDCEVEAVYLTGGATLSAGSASRAFVYLDGVINNREARLDSVKGEGGNEAIFGFGGAESIFGGGGDDLVSGDGGNDYLVGGAGNDRVDAGKGDDVMVGGDGAGDDTYAGGEGIDTVRYPSALAAIRVNLSQGSAQSLSTVEALDAGIGTDVLIGVENVIAGHFGDWIQGDHQSNRLEGLDGNDTLIGSGGPDVLVGGGGNDSIDGGAGDDTVVFAGQRQAYLIQRVAGVSGQITVSSAGGEEGTDTLTDIEFLLFADGVPLSVRNANIPPSGRVEIDGLAEQGQTLTAINTLADADGIGQISCQWRADGANIAGATGTTLTLAQGLVGKAITLVVSYIDQRNTVESITSTATAAVVNVNDAPVANGLSVTAVEDSVQIGMLTATDLDSLNLTYSKVSNPAHGTVAVSSNGLFIYTPAPDFNGTDSFTFKASDGFLDSETATVVITVSPVDDPVTRSIGIKGTAGQGLSLSANLGSLFSSESAATADQPIRYEWRADNAVIAGVGGPELALTPALTGKSITVRVHLFDGQGTDDLVVSNPIGPVVSASVAGEIRYWRGNKPLPNTDIQLFDPDSRPLPSAALAQTQSGADGSWSLPQLDFDTYQLNASKATTVSDLSSVSASDVLAALKLSLGRNPNADPDGPGNVSASAVSRYQLIASDVTQDGLVRADDAVLIMRAAMGRANPQISRWSLLTEALDSSQAPPPAATAGSSIEVEAVNGTISNWIGVLLGDVDGSWGIGPGL